MATALGALLFFTSIPLLYWTWSKQPVSPFRGSNLLGGAVSTDLRENILTQSTTDRALRPAIDGLAALARRATPAGWTAKLDKRRHSAGLAHVSVEKLLAAKVLGGALGLFFGYYLFNISEKSIVKLAALAVPALGFFFVDIRVKSKADERQKMIKRELPDILDQLTVGVEAGLGFDAAVTRTAKTSRAMLALELTRVIQHMAAGLSRAEALRGLATRLDVPELRQFVAAVIQADQYGIPMAQVLRVQSTEQRRRRRQAAEEQAMKLPVKVLFPLVFCILPALFTVVVGPAGIQIARTL